MIVSSFAQQYGIRLYQELDTISYQEYRQLLIGLNGETSLGYVVQIRAESDKKKIDNMTVQEKKIRQEWFAFRNRQAMKRDEEAEKQKVLELQNIFKNLFG